MKTASRLKLAATVASVVRASTRPGSPGIAERVQAVPRLVRCTLDRTYAGTTLKRLGLVAGAVAYVASPVDLLPEAVLPVVGAADDAVVISWAVTAFFEETDRFLAWEAGQGARRARPSDTGGGTGHSHPVGVPADVVPPAPAGLHDGVDGGLRRDRDSTGAAAPRGARGGTDAAGGSGRKERVQLPEGMRQAATDYVLESVRRRLER